MEERYNDIQAYLRGEMTTPDRDAFEAEMARDPALRQEVDLHLMADDAIELVIADSLRRELADMRQEQSGDTTGGAKIRSIATWGGRLAIAASILVVIGFFGTFYVGRQYTDPALAATFYQETSGLRAGSATGDQLAEGRELLSNEQYEAAITYFNGVSDPNYQTEASFLKGLALFENEEYLEAMSTFDSVIQTADIRFREKAEFQYILSSLAANDANGNDRFAEILESIRNDPDHLAHREVEAIYQKRQSFWRNFTRN